jgi:hypothetical protein
MDYEPLPPQPFYGIEGNLLVENLRYSHRVVEDILNGTFEPAFYAQLFMPSVVLTRYPQLKDERAKRAHRKAYRQHLEERRQLPR